MCFHVKLHDQSGVSHLLLLDLPSAVANTCKARVSYSVNQHSRCHSSYRFVSLRLSLRRCWSFQAAEASHRLLPVSLAVHPGLACGCLLFANVSFPNQPQVYNGLSPESVGKQFWETSVINSRLVLEQLLFPEELRQDVFYPGLVHRLDFVNQPYRFLFYFEYTC